MGAGGSSFSFPAVLSAASTPSPPSSELLKTFLSFLWLWSGFFATTTSLALTHEKVCLASVQFCSVLF